MARRKRKVEEQTDLLQEGGLRDEGGTVDPVSGNDVPPGSTQEEVRDDIPAQLSEGEFVFPADVVRYIGLENLMQLRQKAKMGLQKMEDMGQMGNSEEATMSDDVEFNAEVDDMIDNLELAEGGMVPQSVPPVAPPVSLQPPTAMNRTYAMGGQVMSVEQEMMQKQGRNYAQGGVVMPVEQEMMQKSGRRGYAQGGAVMSVEQEMMQKNRPGFAPGGLAGSNPLQSSQVTPVYQAPAQLPTYSSLVQKPALQAAQAVQPVVEQKEYIGPNGERITIQFVNGNPATPIPEGYKPFDPTAQPVTPEIAKPEVSQEDNSDDRAREEARQKEYAGSLTEINLLSELSPEFKEWAEENIPGQVKAAKSLAVDPITGEISFPGMSLSEQIKGIFSGEQFAQLSAGLTELGGTGPYGEAYADIAKSAGIDLGAYNLNNISAKIGLLEDVKNTISDPNFEAKRDARSKLESNRGSYEVSGLTKEEVDAQIAEDLDEIADAIDRGEVGDNRSDEDNNDPGASSDGGYNGPNDAPSDSDFGMNKGGLASPKPIKPKRKPTMKRGALASKK